MDWKKTGVIAVLAAVIPAMPVGYGMGYGMPMPMMGTDMVWRNVLSE